MKTKYEVAYTVLNFTNEAISRSYRFVKVVLEKLPDIDL